VSEYRYQAIASDLRRRIVAGEWEEGQKISSLAHLMDDYGVPSNHNLIRHAQGVLIDEGLLRPEQGSGVFLVRIPGRHALRQAEAREAIRQAMDLLKRAESLLGLEQPGEGGDPAPGEDGNPGEE
jgi:DNA-binding GntR family transcriptional regulator